MAECDYIDNSVENLSSRQRPARGSRKMMEKYKMYNINIDWCKVIIVCHRLLKVRSFVGDIWQLCTACGQGMILCVPIQQECHNHTCSPTGTDL